MIELYKTKGLDPTDAETITKILAKYKDAWLDIMMLEELELGGDEESPIKNALVTFFAFELFGLVPCNFIFLIDSNSIYCWWFIWNGRLTISRISPYDYSCLDSNWRWKVIFCLFSLVDVYTWDSRNWSMYCKFKLWHRKSVWGDLRLVYLYFYIL